MGGERRTTIAKRNTEQKHVVYMHYMHCKGWYCQFLEADLKTPLPRTFTFATADKVRELAERGGGFSTLETRQAFEHGVSMGRGGINLSLSTEQYAKLLAC
jgi:hypothetical protein